MSKVRTTGPGSGESLIRIGELARRAGVPAATLRAWERRYGVVEPRRGSSGYRLYTRGDERRLRSMADLIDQGLAPA
jgi:DNA-binding transcriptional MerR regulator